jgi:hypothetical protein
MGKRKRRSPPALAPWTLQTDWTVVWEALPIGRYGEETETGVLSVHCVQPGSTIPEPETPRPRVGRGVSLCPWVVSPSGASAAALLLRALPSPWRGGGRHSRTNEGESVSYETDSIVRITLKTYTNRSDGSHRSETPGF